MLQLPFGGLNDTQVSVLDAAFKTADPKRISAAQESGMLIARDQTPEDIGKRLQNPYDPLTQAVQSYVSAVVSLQQLQKECAQRESEIIALQEKLVELEAKLEGAQASSNQDLAQRTAGEIQATQWRLDDKQAFQKSLDLAKQRDKGFYDSLGYKDANEKAAVHKSVDDRYKMVKEVHNKLNGLLGNANLKGEQRKNVLELQENFNRHLVNSDPAKIAKVVFGNDQKAMQEVGALGLARKNEVNTQIYEHFADKALQQTSTKVEPQSKAPDSKLNYAFQKAASNYYEDPTTDVSDQKYQENLFNRFNEISDKIDSMQKKGGDAASLKSLQNSCMDLMATMKDDKNVGHFKDFVEKAFPGQKFENLLAEAKERGVSSKQDQAQERGPEETRNYEPE